MPSIFLPIMKLLNEAILFSIFLHGAGDDQTGWVQFGEVLTIADAGNKIGNSNRYDHYYA